MGFPTDNAKAGIAFKPSVSDMANILANWNPRTDDVEALDLPDTDDFEPTPWAATTDTDNRIELHASMAGCSKFIFGYVERINEKKTENSKTGYRLEVVAKIVFTPGGCAGSTDVSWIFRRVLAYTSNCIIADNASLILGTPGVGVLSAGYNGRGRAVLESWHPATDWSLWRSTRPNAKFAWGTANRTSLSAIGSPSSADALSLRTNRSRCLILAVAPHPRRTTLSFPPGPEALRLTHRTLPVTPNRLIPAADVL